MECKNHPLLIQGIANDKNGVAKMTSSVQGQAILLTIFRKMIDMLQTLCTVLVEL
jgi:hypothetical protein